MGAAADVIGSFDAGALDELFAVFNDVVNLHVDHGADGEIAAAFVFELAAFFFYKAGGVRPNLHLGG